MRKSEFHPSEIPSKPGVYVFRDRFGKVIYVGKASNLRRRMSSYFQPSRVARADAKLRSLIHSIDDWSYETVRSEDEALILESRLIKDFAPHYNVLMRDDKRYLLLKVDWREKFPTLKLARLKKNDGAQYFGPFPRGGALRMTLEFLLAHFGLRACRDSEPDEETRRRCLTRIVKECCAPCVGAVTPEEYRKRVEQAVAVLQGDIRELAETVRGNMLAAAQAQQFEKAARLRDVLTNLESVFGRRSRAFWRPELPDAAPGMAAIDALVEIGCPPLPVIGLAKRNEEIYLPGRSEPIVLDRHDPALRMLQALRDEAHRFAITYHRELRNRRIEQSRLDEIPGIGDIRKKQLLRAFGSLARLKKASVEEIAEKVPGIGENVARKILDNLAARPVLPPQPLSE